MQAWVCGSWISEQQYPFCDVYRALLTLTSVLFYAGLDLWELDVRTGLQPAHPRPARVESAARSERAVYSWLNAISTGARASAAALGDTVSSAVFCGANRDDEENPARCGLACAPELGVAAPLADLSADKVSMLAQVCPPIWD